MIKQGQGGREKRWTTIRRPATERVPVGVTSEIGSKPWGKKKFARGKKRPQLCNTTSISKKGLSKKNGREVKECRGQGC